MKRTLLTIMAILAILSFSQAQTIDSNLRYWNEGPLKWEDFTVRNYKGDIRSSMHLVYNFKPVSKKTGNLTVRYYQANTAMDKGLSWVRTEDMTADELAYNQLLFDISEVNRREMQAELNNISSNYSKADIMDYYGTKNRQMIKELEDESDYGMRKQIVGSYAARTAEKLSHMPEDSIPEFECRNVGYGMHLGLESDIYMGDGALAFNPIWSFIYGFELAYKRSSLFLEMAMGTGSVNNTFDFTAINNGKAETITWHAGNPVYSVEMDLVYGFAVIDNDRFKVSPIVGIGLNALSDSYYAEEETGTIGGLHASAGLNIDWKFNRTVSYAPSFFASEEYTETTLRTKVYVAYNGYMAGFNPYTINVAVMINMFGRMLK